MVKTFVAESVAAIMCWTGERKKKKTDLRSQIGFLYF
jgi:hypothetical protein